MDALDLLLEDISLEDLDDIDDLLDDAELAIDPGFELGDHDEGEK